MCVLNNLDHFTKIKTKSVVKLNRENQGKYFLSFFLLSLLHIHIHKTGSLKTYNNLKQSEIYVIQVPQMLNLKQMFSEHRKKILKLLTNWLRK